MTEPKTHSLDLPGATVTYDVREAESESAEPVLLMIGSPMDASGFTSLAGHFPGPHGRDLRLARGRA